MKQQHEFYSIFGQIEAAVANAMIEEGKMRRIQAQDIPHGPARWNGQQQALFAVYVNRAYIPEFERRIADLRA